MTRTMMAAAGAALASLTLAACGTVESLEGRTSMDASTIIVGSQDYYSNEIIAEAYAQALEGAGFAVDRQMRIGQREVYMPELEAGSIDVFPEYTGNLLQYLDQNASAHTSQESTTRWRPPAHGATRPRSVSGDRPGLLRGDLNLRGGAFGDLHRRPGGGRPAGPGRQLGA